MRAERRVRSAEGRAQRADGRGRRNSSKHLRSALRTPPSPLRPRPSALCSLLLFACTNPPVQDTVTIQFSDDSNLVTVTAETRFELKPANDQIRKRVDTAREAAQANVDAWAMRFGRFTPESERRSEE